MQTPRLPASSYDQASLVLLLLFERLVFIQIAVYPRQLQRFDADHLVFCPAFIAGDHIAFLYFVQFDVKSILAFRT
jgi:hypothetical protein